MRSAFDGLHSILGNSVVAVPEVDAAAVAQIVPSPAPPNPPVDAAPFEHARDSAPRVTRSSSANALADIPGLSELDRGLYAGAGNNSDDDTSAALDALDRGLANSTPRPVTPRSGNAPLLNNTGSIERDGGLFAGKPVRPIAIQVDEREIGGWVAAAVMAFGLVLGATAAIAIFHDDVSHIVASWDGPSTTAHQKNR